MESFLKRKTDGKEGDNKRIKLEECPHGNRCFRRNPHHFKEFSHAHLMKMIEDNKIPEDFPQDKNVYEEQLVILKPLLKIIENKNKQLMSSSSSSAVTKAEEPSSKNLRDCEPGTSSTKPLPLNKDVEIKADKGTTLEKLQNAAPYNIFFTTIPESKKTYTHSNTLTFSDLLCPSLGKLKCSLQINFMIDIMWLMEQYKKKDVHKKPLTILYGDDWPDMKEFIEKYLPQVTHHLVKMKDPFGCHHSKIGIYIYEDNSLRVVVSTANLYYEDWNNYNQGFWLSPLCKRLPEGSKNSGESPTGFKKCLLDYLKTYKLGVLKDWIDYVQNADFSDIKVFLVTSVPGKHYPNSVGSHLHHVGDLLSRYCKLPKKTSPESEGPLSWGIIAQSSSIGSLGNTPSDWLRRCILRSLSGHKDTQLVSNSSATLSVIFPTMKNVMDGYFGAMSGGCLPYMKKTHEKQKWLHSYLHQWKADKLERTRAMPHIKTYCRISPCLTKLAWFLITSSNLSKAAWGNGLTKDMSTYVRSYEAGVMFLPQFFDEEYFEIANTSSGKNKKLFPFIYDLPLTEYKKDDYPYCT